MGVIVERTRYPGWDGYPAYRCRTQEGYQEVLGWMRRNGVREFLLASGACGYIFQVRDNQLLFEMRWG